MPSDREPATAARWAVVVVAPSFGTKESRSRLFNAVCEAVVEVEGALDVDIDISGMPLVEVAEHATALLGETA